MFNRNFWLFLLLFLALNILLYSFISLYHHKVPFSSDNYKSNAYHFLSDPRSETDNDFVLLRALGQYDAQWYLRIATHGYPKNPPNENVSLQNAQNGLSYAFFPLYPVLLSITDIPIQNIELTAFLISNILMLAIFASLYFVIQSFYNVNTAVKTIFLLFLFPFSIFYRSYFTEGLFLLILIWFLYFLIKKRFIVSAVFLALTCITRPNGLLLAPFFLFIIAYDYIWERISLKILLVSLLISAVPFSGWLLFCYINTGSPFYWASVQSNWTSNQNISFPLLHNIDTFLRLPSLPLHTFHASKLETLTVASVGILLVLSRKKLKPELWWVSFLFWLFPLLFKDTMSYTRYQIVSFPLFLYLAQKTNRTGFIILLILFSIGLLLLSLFFINWYWVG
ncbi:MAG TPA: hypothetical protein VM077_04455 [Candidatus Limnocylindrales bacterium]|nr:hypothetical protein [Candidatus Limnocylindrales bacterium]